MNFVRPYLAVVKDSFRAALANRVLYVMIVAITLVLVVFAPFAVHESIHWKIQEDDIEPRFQAIFALLINAKDDESRPDIQKIWGSLDEGLQNDIVEVEKSLRSSGTNADEAGLNPFKLGSALGGLRRAFNELAEDETFYDEETWKRIPKSDELSTLIESGEDRSELQSKRMNRLLLESSIPMMRRSQSSAIEFKYLHWDITTLNFTRDQFKAAVVSQLPYYFDKFVMSIGLFVAILITSNMIPEMFNPGTLNLLLSKPVHRWALLIAKFFGGCAFITLCSTYLFAGLWLILGIQWGIWETSILLSIVLYMIVFAIYYSVSTFVGLVFRSSIVSVICTILFWAICFFTGVVYSLFNLGIEKNEVTQVVPTEEGLYYLDYFENLHKWDAASNEWDREIAGANEQAKLTAQVLYGAAYFQAWFPQAITQRQQMVPPTYSKKYQAFLAGGYGPQGIVLDPPDMFVFDTETDGEYMPRDTFPSQTRFLYQENSNGDLLAVTRSGLIYRLVDDPVTAPVIGRPKNKPLGENKNADNSENDDTQDQDDKSTSESSADEKSSKNEDDENDVAADTQVNQATGNETQEDESPRVDKQKDDANSRTVVPTGATKKKYFEKVVALPIGRVESPGSVSVNPITEELAHYNDGKVSVYKKDTEGKYVFDRRVDLQLGATKDFSHWIAYRGNYIVVAVGSGDVILIAAETMEDLEEFKPEAKVGIKQLAASEGGRWFAILYQNGNLWLMDSNESELSFVKPRKISQGNISGANFDAEGNLCVGGAVGRLDIYDPSDWSKVQSIRPDHFTLQTSFERVIRPLYWLCPKPGEFYPLVAHLSRERSDDDEKEVDWSVTPQKKNPWSPVINGLVFMAFMLFISCIWFQRSDY